METRDVRAAPPAGRRHARLPATSVVLWRRLGPARLRSGIVPNERNPRSRASRAGPSGHVARSGGHRRAEFGSASHASVHVTLDLRGARAPSLSATRATRSLSMAPLSPTGSAPQRGNCPLCSCLRSAGLHPVNPRERARGIPEETIEFCRAPRPWPSATRPVVGLLDGRRRERGTLRSRPRVKGQDLRLLLQDDAALGRRATVAGRQPALDRGGALGSGTLVLASAAAIRGAGRDRDVHRPQPDRCP